MILCGGLGTRLGSLTARVPKAMMPVLGRPFLEYEVGLLRRSGVRELVLCVGHLGERVREHFGDGGAFGVSISYSFDGPELLGPAGALRRAAPLLGSSFFVTYGDAYLRADYPAVMARLLGSRALGLMTTYRNEGRHGRSDLVVERGRVVRYDKKGDAPGMRWVNFGVSALRKEALELIPPGVPCGEEEFYGRLIARGQLLAFPVRRRFYEIGTPSSLDEFARFASRTGVA